MFSKLLKYDFKSVKRFGLPLVFIALALSLLGGVNGFFFAKALSSENANFISIISVLTFMLIIYAVVICASITAIFVYVDFYKSLCTDQGYLTFTLPVSSTSLLNSKIVNSLIWLLISTVTMGVCLFVILSGVKLGLPPSDPSIPSDGIGAIISMFDITDAVLGIVTMVLYALNSQMLIFMVIFFASVISNRYKAITAIALVLATNVAYSIVYSIISAIISTVMMGAGDAATTLTYSIFIILLVASGIGYYIATKHMMEKKLNLP